MKILVKYVLKDYLYLFLFFFASFLSLFVIVDLFDKLSDLLQYEITAGQIVLYYFNFLPELIVLIVPLSVLLSSIVFFRKISSNNEYMAMVQGGFPLYKMMFPIVLATMFLCIFVFVVQNYIVPGAYFRKKKIEVEHFIKKGDKHKKIIKRIRVFSKKRGKTNLIYIEKYNIKKKLAYDITIIVKDSKKAIEIKRIIAEKAKWNGGEWILENVTILDRSAGYIEEKKFSRPSLVIDFGATPNDFILPRRNPKTMYLSNLKEIALQLKSSRNKEYYEFVMEYYRRFAFPFSPIVLLFVSIPFGLMQRRGHKFLGIGIGIIIGLLFYVFQSVFWALGKGGIIHPIIANWSVNILFLLAGLVMVHFSPR